MRERRSREQWEQLVGEWTRSGLSGAEFARRRGLRQPRLEFWRWKLGRSGRREAAVRLLPVSVEQPVSGDARAVIEFGAGGTVRLEFGLDADPGAIAALVAVLRAATC